MGLRGGWAERRVVGGATGVGRGRGSGGGGAVAGRGRPEVGECGRDALPLQEFGELAAVGEARAAHPYVLLQAQVLHLVLDPGERAA